MNIIEKFKILFEIMYPDTQIDEQFKCNGENLVEKFPKELSDASAFISEFEVFIDVFYQLRKRNLNITTCCYMLLKICYLASACMLYNDQLRKRIDFKMFSKLPVFFVRSTISMQ